MRPKRPRRAVRCFVIGATSVLGALLAGACGSRVIEQVNQDAGPPGKCIGHRIDRSTATIDCSAGRQCAKTAGTDGLSCSPATVSPPLNCGSINCLCSCEDRSASVCGCVL